MRIRLLTAWVVALVVMCGTALAQTGVPDTIKVNGVLPKRIGTIRVPTDGEVSLTFGIYDAPREGNLLWSETQKVVLTGGAYSATVGSETPIDTTIFSGDDKLWLGVSFQGAEVLPRRALPVVPGGRSE